MAEFKDYIPTGESEGAQGKAGYQDFVPEEPREKPEKKAEEAPLQAEPVLEDEPAPVLFSRRRPKR